MADEPRWLSGSQQSAWQAYRLMTRQLDAHLARQLARDSGLSLQDYDVLSSITDRPGHRRCAKDLGAHLLWSPSRLSHHLDRMQRRGLVRREDCPDGRGTDVVLTSDGLRAITEAAPGHVAAVRDAFIDQLGDDELAVLAQISRTVRQRLTGAPTRSSADPGSERPGRQPGVLQEFPGHAG